MENACRPSWPPKYSRRLTEWGPAVFQPRMATMPGAGLRGAVAGGLRAAGVLGAGPGGRISQEQQRAMATRAAPSTAAGFDRAGQYPVRAQPPDQHHRQVGQQERQPAHVVAGVEHDPDGRVARAPVPGPAQPIHDLAQLRGGHRGRVVGGSEADRVQHRGPAAAPGLQRGHDRVRPARDHLGVALRPAVDVAEQPLRAGLGVRTQPRRDVGGQHDPVPDPRQRHAGHAPAQAGDLDRPVVEPVVQRAVPASMLRGQRQIHQRPHRPVRAQQRIGQLELRVRP